MKRFLFIILVLGTSTLLVPYFQSGEQKPKTNQPAKSAATKAQSAEALMGLPIHLTDTRTDSLIPPKCLNAWPELLESKFSEFTSNLESLKRALGSPECLQQSHYKNSDKLLSSCRAVFYGTNNTVTQKQIVDDCAKDLIFYRAYVIHFMTQNSQDYKALSTEVLLNKLAALISVEGAQDLKAIDAIGDALSENEPHLYAAQKANLVAKTFNFTALQKDSPDFAAYEETFHKVLSKVEALNTDDPEVVEARFLPDILKSDFDAMRDGLEHFANTNGESALTYYYRSALAWRDRNSILAHQYLDEAIRLSPENSQYLETKQKLAGLKLGESGAYTLKLQFDFLNN